MSKPTELQAPPAEASPTPAEPTTVDVKDFTPKSRGRELDDIVAGREPEPTPEPTPAPEPEPAPAPSDEDKVVDDTDHSLPDMTDDIFSPIKMTEPTPAPEDKKQKSNNLRDSLVIANERVKAYEQDNDILQKKVEELEEAQAQSRRANTQVDPSTHPDVRALITPWNDEMESMSKQMTLTGSDGAKLKQHAQQLVERYRDLGDPETEGFADRRDELINTIEENFPNDKKEVVGIIAKGAQTLSKVQGKIAEIQENGEVVRSEAEFEQFKEVKANYAAIEETFFNPSDDLKEAEPYSPKVVLARHIDSSPEVAQRADSVKTFLRKALLPLPPIKASDVEGMSPQEKSNYAQNRLKNDQAVKHQFHAMVGDAFLALGMISGMDETATKMRSENQDYRKATPRLGAGEAGDEDDREEGEIDVKDFNPGPSKLNFNN